MTNAMTMPSWPPTSGAHGHEDAGQDDEQDAGSGEVARHGVVSEVAGDAPGGFSPGGFSSVHSMLMVSGRIAAIWVAEHQCTATSRDESMIADDSKRKRETASATEAAAEQAGGRRAAARVRRPQRARRRRPRRRAAREAAERAAGEKATPSSAGARGPIRFATATGKTAASLRISESGRAVRRRSDGGASRDAGCEGVEVGAADGWIARRFAHRIRRIEPAVTAI